MIVLDENIDEEQVPVLEGWGIRVRHIGLDIGRKGMQDDDIIPFLLQIRRPTFFTLDTDFYRRSLCHARYCLVYLAIEHPDAAIFVRRVLKHHEFDTEAKRVGAVLRASSAGITFWRLHAAQEERLDWP